MDRYRITPIAPGMKFKPVYVEGADKIEAAVDRLKARYAGKSAVPRAFEVAIRHEYFNNGSWKASYRSVEEVSV